MSHGTAAAYADVIDEEIVDKFCHKELTEFKEAVDKYSDMGEVAWRAGFEGGLEDLADELDNREILDCFETLAEMFEAGTGLELCLGFHDSEMDGSGYDQVDGIYWAVGGMYELTPAGKKMEQYVQRKQWVINC
jgi:hypothetical protein